ncbi:MAG TPA: RDD family protein [Gammaproteobacteria bacterium]|nr:RDD family protein [Gammaproteobacteria bacterium]
MQRLRLLIIRLMAAVYDALILVAIWIMATLALMPFTGGAIDPPLPWNIPFDLYIFGVSFLYLGGLWRKTGQTLGARAWRLKVVAADGGQVSWREALLRAVTGTFAIALAGIAWLWMLFDRDGLALHDRLSGTRMVRVPKE